MTQKGPKLHFHKRLRGSPSKIPIPLLLGNGGNPSKWVPRKNDTCKQTAKNGSNQEDLRPRTRQVSASISSSPKEVQSMARPVMFESLRFSRHLKTEIYGTNKRLFATIESSVYRGYRSNTCNISFKQKIRLKTSGWLVEPPN